MSAHLMAEHPAARMVFDERGRNLSLGLSEAEIRLECLKIVAGAVRREPGDPLIPAETMADRARILADFVLGGAAIAEGIRTASAASFEKATDFPNAKAADTSYPGYPEQVRTPLSKVARDAIRDRLNALRSAVADQEQKVASRIETSRDYAEVAESLRRALASNRDAIAMLEHDLGEPSAP